MGKEEKIEYCRQNVQHLYKKGHKSVAFSKNDILGVSDSKIKKTKSLNN